MSNAVFRTILLMFMVSTRYAVSALFIAGFVAAMSGVAVAFPPANFQRELVASDLGEAINFDFIPGDDRIMVLDKRGEILLVDLDTVPATITTYMTVADIETGQERGLQDVTFDPDFEHNGFFYLYYQHGSSTRSRISRFVHEGDTADPSHEVLIWEDNEHWSGCCHYGGGLEFSPIDGTLYFTTGDEADPSQAQSLSRAGGKVLRINEDGSIPEDNPFFDGPGPNLDEIYCLGLRNPFRGGFDPQTGRYILGEVGHDAWENIYQAERGANFGWPICAGNCRPPNPLYTDPIHTYAHSGPRDAQGTGSAIGGDVYRGNNLPSLYQGAYFYGDFAQGWVRYLTFDADGKVNGDFAFDDFLSDPGFFPALVALHEGPDGALYVLFMDANLNFQISGTAIYRYVYNDGTQGPQIFSTSADVTTGNAPLTVNFAAVVEDPDTPDSSLEYRWIFGDGHEMEGLNVSHTYISKGSYTARVIVSDGNRTTISDGIEVTVGTPPVVTITSPIDGAFFRGNDVIRYAGTAVIDGDLTDATFEWTVRFLHDEHTHPVIGPVEALEGEFVVPVTGHDFADNTGFAFILEVVDAEGLSTTESVSIFPEKVRLAFDTLPPGLPFVLDGLPRETPLAFDSMIHFEHSIVVPDFLCEVSARHTFRQWSDGSGTVNRIFVVPEDDQSLVASYNVGGACAGDACKLAMSFGGDDEYVRLADIHLSGSFTLEAWVHLAPGISNQDGIVTNEVRSQDINFYANRVRLYAPGDVIIANTPTSPNTWNHYAFTRKNGLLTLYINGVPDATGNWGGTFVISRIGAAVAGFTEGDIDEVRVWNVARSADEIEHNYRLPVPADAPGLVGYWKFNDDPGDQVVHDSSPAGRNGTRGLSLSTTFDPDRVPSSAPITAAESCQSEGDCDSRSLSFDGVDDTVHIPDLNLDGAFTIEAWALLNDVIDGDDALVGSAPGSPDLHFLGGRLRVSSFTDLLTANTPTSPDTWTHYAVTQSDGELNLYVNGLLDATGSWPGSSLTIRSLGKGRSNGFTRGFLDEVRIWSVARTGSEIHDHYRDVVSSSATGLVGYWKFNEVGDDQTVSDSSAHARHGSLGMSLAAESSDPVRVVADTPMDLSFDCGEACDREGRCKDFRRGDANNDGLVTLVDAMGTLFFLFEGGVQPACKDALDTDDSGRADLTDPVRLLTYLFLAGAAPGAPGPRDCGPDPTLDSLDCAVSQCD